MRFGPAVALRDVSFTLQCGTVAGLLGPNGAGKSTAMRCLAGYYGAYAGTIRVDGEDMRDARLPIQSKIGYVPESAHGFQELTVLEFLKFAAQSRLGRKRRSEAVERVFAHVDMSPVMHRTLGSLSKGWRQRAWLAQALVHDPSILILDEPTDGLDPLQKQSLRTAIANLAERKTILVSTHILEEVEELCGHAIIISDGLVLEDSPTVDLLDGNGRIFSRYRQAVADA